MTKEELIMELITLKQQYPQYEMMLHSDQGSCPSEQHQPAHWGMDTNSVIAGHRGYSGADYFCHLDKLEVGHKVRLINLWETLSYRVVDIQIIAPSDIQKIYVQEGHDLLTLLTCHPYASGGKQRLVIYCERE